MKNGTHAQEKQWRNMDLTTTNPRTLPSWPPNPKAALTIKHVEIISHRPNLPLLSARRTFYLYYRYAAVMIRTVRVLSYNAYNDFSKNKRYK